MHSSPVPTHTQSASALPSTAASCIVQKQMVSNAVLDFTASTAAGLVMLTTYLTQQEMTQFTGEFCKKNLFNDAWDELQVEIVNRYIVGRATVVKQRVKPATVLKVDTVFLRRQQQTTRVDYTRTGVKRHTDYVDEITRRATKYIQTNCEVSKKFMTRCKWW